MANNEIKTNAEIYREQRKERLAKAQKKKSGKGDKIIRVLIKTICILLIAGIVLYGVGSIMTKVLCIPQKLLTVATYEDEKINVAEYNYYYMSLYNQIVNTTSQIDSYYGSGYGAYYTGFDATKDPADQEYIGEDAPEGVTTWSDYFRLMAPEKAFIQREIYKEAISEEAKKAGFEVTNDVQLSIDEEIDSTIEQYETYAKDSDMSLDNYLARVWGEGLSEKTYREFLNRDMVVEKYLTWYQENIAETTSDKDVKEYYKENRLDFDMVDARLFAFSYAEAAEDTESDDPTYTKSEAKKLANEFKGKVTDEESFVELGKEYALPSQKATFEEDSATLAENLSSASISAENITKWLFDTDRKAGDVTVLEDEATETFYVAYIINPAAPDKNTAGADVRHLLVQAETTKTDSEGNEVDLSQDEIDKNFAEAKKEAEKLLKQWKKGKATEKSFASLVTGNTDDTGSKDTGGLYEDITSTSSYVPEFLDWALAPHKKGDTDIIKTDYGYHIMYFVGADETEKWESDVRSAIASEKYNDFSTDIYDKVSESVEKNETIINLFVGSNEKLLTSHAASYAASASQSSSITY